LLTQKLKSRNPKENTMIPTNTNQKDKQNFSSVTILLTTTQS